MIWVLQFILSGNVAGGNFKFVCCWLRRFSFCTVIIENYWKRSIKMWYSRVEKWMVLWNFGKLRLLAVIVVTNQFCFWKFQKYCEREMIVQLRKYNKSYLLCQLEYFYASAVKNNCILSWVLFVHDCSGLYRIPTANLKTSNSYDSFLYIYSV